MEMTEEELLTEQLVVLYERYRIEAQPIIGRLVAIRAARPPSGITPLMQEVNLGRYADALLAGNVRKYP